MDGIICIAGISAIAFRIGRGVFDFCWFCGCAASRAESFRLSVLALER